MKKQSIVISFNNPFTHLIPIKELVQQLQYKLRNAAITHNVAPVVSLDLKAVSIHIECNSCDAVLQAIKPILNTTDVQTKAKIVLNYDQENGKYIDFKHELGNSYKELDQDCFKIGADFLKEHIDPKQGFLLISYSKNGNDINLFTENGKAEQTELMDLYKLFVTTLL